jgi:hypothetical protein
VCGIGNTHYESGARPGQNELPLIPLVTRLFPVKKTTADRDPSASKAWQEYVESANMRMEQHLSPGKAFLWVDEVPDRLALVRAGEIVVSPVGPRNPIRVPSGLIHDWVGSVFIPDATLTGVLQVVRDYVIDPRVLATDTGYEFCDVHVDDRCAYSVSRTTRIREIGDYGTPGWRILHEGQGAGIISRLFSIARFVERDGGVYVELEAIGLSRDIPASLRWLVQPIVRRVSRRSLSTSLQHTLNTVVIHTEFASCKDWAQRCDYRTGRGAA